MPDNSIDAWLNEIGLDQLQALFAEQQIEVEAMPELSE